MRQRPRILVTDDDASVRKALVKWFEYSGFHVAEAENGRMAVEACSRGRYDVVVMDHNMPVMNGEKAIQEIKRANPVLPIIVYSAAVHIAEGYAGGQAFSIVPKPKSMTMLEMEVRRALETVRPAGSVAGPILSAQRTEERVRPPTLEPPSP